MRARAALLLFLPACHLFVGPMSVTGAPLEETALPCPSSNDEWHLVASEHFDVYSNRMVSVVRNAAVELERTFAALSQLPMLAPLLTTPPPGRITIVLFGSRDDFMRLKPDPRYGGGFTAVNNELEPRPVITVWAEFGVETRELLVHELFHRFLAQVAPNAPLWLNEGLAQYVSTLTLSGQEASIGDVPATLYRYNRELLTRPEIYAGDRSDVSDFYAGAFALVHLFNDTPKRQQAFREYLALLARGVPNNEARAQAMGHLDWRNIDGDLPAYLPRVSYVRQKFPYRAPSVALSPARAVGHAELHRLWATIRPWRRQNLTLVEHDLDEAEALEPASPEARRLRIRLLAERGDAEGVLARVEPLRAANPNDIELRLLYAWAIGKRNPPDRDAALAELREVLPAAQTPGALFTLAAMLGALGQASDALAASDRALRISPGEQRLHLVRAWALHLLARDVDAVEEQLIGIALAQHGQDTRVLTARLAEYQRALTEKANKLEKE